MQHIYMMDSKGLITTKRGDKLPQHKQLMAHGDDVPVLKDLKDVIAHVKPHALIGLTGAGPAFKKVRLTDVHLVSLQTSKCLTAEPLVSQQYSPLPSSFASVPEGRGASASTSAASKTRCYCLGGRCRGV